MFGFGKSKAAKELDEVLKSLQLAFENNYKDNVRANLQKFERVYGEMVAEGRLKSKENAEYGEKLVELKERLKNFHH